MEEKNVVKDVKSNVKNNVVLSVVSLVTTAVIIVGVFFLARNIQGKKAQGEAKQSVIKLLDGFKNGDEDTIKGYLTENDESISINEIMVLSSKIEYEIKNVSGNSKRVDVEAEIKNKNMNDVLTKFYSLAMSAMWQNALSEENEQNDFDWSEYLMQAVADDNIPTETTNITISLEKNNNNWEIVSSKEEFSNAIFPKLNEFIEEINKQISESGSQQQATDNGTENNSGDPENTGTTEQ